MVRHSCRVADGAEEDGVVIADLRLPVGRHHRSMLEVMIATPVEFVPLESDIVLARRGVQATQPFRHDFLADAVAGDDSDSMGFHDFLLPR